MTKLPERGSAYKTSGGLTKGRIVSLKKHTRKGKFGYIRIKSKSRKNKKGGKMVGESVEPAEPVEEETPVAPAPMDTASSTPREKEISEPVKSEPVKNAVGGKKSRKSHR